jgi:hypothetical protein
VKKHENEERKYVEDKMRMTNKKAKEKRKVISK